MRQRDWDESAEKQPPTPHYSKWQPKKLKKVIYISSRITEEKVEIIFANSDFKKDPWGGTIPLLVELYLKTLDMH